MLINLLLGVFATWRVSEILTFEKISDPFRSWLFKKAHTRITKGKRLFVFLNDLFGCVKCVSVWCGFFFALLYLLLPQIYFWVALGFTFSAFTVILNHRVYN